ncbi:MAG: MmcQ/YjbR family DNA-binding protein [Clostridia bacterium]|nr:MmcQ/YjbR family DNA-binding protein [Clostridia bacterium]
MTKEELESYIQTSCGVTAEHPFARYPDVSVFRHNSNQKWFAAIMQVNAKKLALAKNETVWIVNLKIAEEIRDSFLHQQGIFPAYHMNKKHWVSVLLDGSVDNDTLTFLLDVSYDLTKKV